MLDILSSLPITIFKVRAAAEALIAGYVANGAGPDEYRIVERADGRFVIECYDEDGIVLGVL